MDIETKDRYPSKLVVEDVSSTTESKHFTCENPKQRNNMNAADASFSLDLSGQVSGQVRKQSTQNVRCICYCHYYLLTLRFFIVIYFQKNDDDENQNNPSMSTDMKSIIEKKLPLSDTDPSKIETQPKKQDKDLLKECLGTKVCVFNCCISM